MERRRVVVTGLGAINAIGHNVEETWKSIKAVSYTHLDVYKRQRQFSVISVNIMFFR